MLQIAKKILSRGLTHQRQISFTKCSASLFIYSSLFTRQHGRGKGKFILALSLALCFLLLPERAHADCFLNGPDGYPICQSEQEAMTYMNSYFFIGCPGDTPRLIAAGPASTTDTCSSYGGVGGWGNNGCVTTVYWCTPLCTVGSTQACTATGFAGNQCSGTQTCFGSEWGAQWGTTCQPDPSCYQCAENQTQPCTTTGTAGYPCTGTQTCYGGRQWGTCQPDASCNQCANNATQACNTTGTAGYPCTGTQACSGGQWGTCQPDASCNQCADNTTQACTAGCPIGGGTQTCSGGQWGGCVCTNQCQTADCGNKCNSADCNTTCVGSSANLKTGNLTHNQDVSTAPKSLPFALTYNSNDLALGPFGRGWTHTYNVLISVVTNTSGNISSLIFTEDSGNKINFTPSVGLYSPDASSGDTSTIAVNADGTYTRTLKDGTLQTFDASGILISIKDRNNNTTTLSYSGGNLVAVTDSPGRSLSITASSGRITSITDPAGQTYNFTYNGNLLTAVTDPAGNAWNYTYDANGRMLTKTDPAGFQTNYAYDANGMLTSATDPTGLSKTLTYDNTNSAAQFVEKDGGVWNQQYDSALNLPTQKTDPQGNVTSYTYDSNGNMLTKTDPDGSITTYTYDAKSNLTSITDTLGQTTTYTYNNFSEVTLMKDPLGYSTLYTYDAQGNLLSSTNPTGATTNYQYDVKGNLVRIMNALNRTTTLTYNQYNNVASITDPMGAVTRITYDINGNITSQIDATGNTMTFAYNNLNQMIQAIDPNGNTTTFEYDGDGNRTLQVDANGNATYYVYNYKGKLTRVEDALGGITSLAYSGTGCATCGGGVDQLTALVDANGNTTNFSYDELGRLKRDKTPRPQGSDSSGNTTWYSYDANGNLVSRTDANSATINYTYDAIGRPLTKSYPDGSTTTFTYDAKGNILTAANDNISYSFTYDANGRVMSVTDSVNTVSYTYDAVGNKTQMIYPDGSTVNYIYNSANRLSKIKDGNKNYTFAYDKTGKRTTLTLPNGAAAKYTYDVSGKLTSLIHTSSTGTIIASSAYTLDRVGNRLTASGMNGGNTYSYDAVYNLQSALPGGNADYGPEEYTYDLMGNRLAGPKPHGNYAYNQENQLITKNAQLFAYNKNGNLITHETDTTTFDYAYDYENRLTEVLKDRSGTETTTQYKYDPFGRRIEKKVINATGAITTNYVYDGQNIIFEYDNETGLEKSRYIHGPKVDEPLAMVRGDTNTHHYYHADGLGSIIAITDKDQQVVETYTYSAFGVVKGEGNGIRNPYRFAGREWDAEAGLYYYRARYYDPKTGRFISKDPIGFAGGINLYAYVGNNPINRIDPFGLQQMIGTNNGIPVVVSPNGVVTNGFPENNDTTNLDNLSTIAELFENVGHGIIAIVEFWLDKTLILEKRPDQTACKN